MKRVRLVILTGLVVTALFAAVLPALAVPDLYDTHNLGFMGDKNGDNVPDKWNVTGDVFRACNHPYTAYTSDSCMMVFPPSNKAAALWQRYDNDDDLIWVVLEEGQLWTIGGTLRGAKRLDWYRAYFGIRFYYTDGSEIVVYDSIPGGNYPFTWQNFEHTFSGPGADPRTDNQASVLTGIMVLPGDGYLGIDMILPWWYP